MAPGIISRDTTAVADFRLVDAGPALMLRSALQFTRTSAHRWRSLALALTRATAPPSLVPFRKLPAQPAPLRQLSPKIEQLRQDAIALLTPHPTWHALASERHSLRQKIERDLAAYAKPASTAAAREAAHERWFLHELLGCMRAFDNYFLLSYNVDAAAPLSQSLLPAQQRTLDAALSDMLRTTAASDWPRLLAIIGPEVLSAYRAKPDLAPWIPSAAAEADRLPYPCEPLTQDELLALIDYLHPYTRHFIVINGGLRLSRYWGVEGIAQATRLLRNPFLRALAKLQRSGLFTDRSGLYAKGIVAGGDAMRLRMTLDFLGDRDGYLIPPHPISATRLIDCSFERMVGRPEDTAVMLHLPEGIDVSPFHGAFGKRLGEVILLPQPLKRCAIDAVSHGPGPAATATYHLQAAEPRLKCRSISELSVLGRY